MKVKIVEQDKEKILLEWVDITCPCCDSKNICIHQYYNDVELSSKKLINFFKKRVILKKRRYICNNCCKTFFCKTVFSEGIFTEELKPILKLLFKEDLINEKQLDRNILKELKINDGEWVILNENKTLTLIDKDSCEIKEFLKIKKNKIEIINQGDKEWRNTKKIIEYKPLNRKARHKIIK